PTSVIYTLSLHDALPILLASINNSCGLFAAFHFGNDDAVCPGVKHRSYQMVFTRRRSHQRRNIEWSRLGYQRPDGIHSEPAVFQDRKSTRLNSSHVSISY